MKSFKQFIAERVWHKDPFLILQNPGWNELKNMMKKSKIFHEARFMIEKKTKLWYIWDTNEAIHGHVAALISGINPTSNFDWDVKPFEYDFRYRVRIRKGVLTLVSDLERVDMKGLMKTKMYKRMLMPSGLPIKGVEGF